MTLFFSHYTQIDKRYTWLKKHLIQFEERYASIFPGHWDVSQRIATQFCHQTRQDLTKVMGKRRHEINVKILLSAIQKTCSFENLLFLRFRGYVLEANDDSTNPFLTPSDEDATNPFLQPPTPAVAAPPPEPRPVVPNKFNRIITQCFDPFLYIYVDSQDKYVKHPDVKYFTLFYLTSSVTQFK